MEGRQAVNVQLASNPAECVPLLARAFRYGVEGEIRDMSELGQVVVFEMLDAGRRVGAFALEVVTDDEGRHHLNVLAAGGVPGYDLTGDMVRAVEREARERVRAASIGCHTKRRGLVRRLVAEGFTVNGTEVRKAM